MMEKSLEVRANEGAPFHIGVVTTERQPWTLIALGTIHLFT